MIPAVQVNSLQVAPQGTQGGIYRTPFPTPAKSTGPLQINWLKVISGPSAPQQTAVFNFTALTGNNSLQGIQTAFVDNSNCPFGVIIQDSAGNNLDLPAGWQGYFDVAYVQNATISVMPDIPGAIAYSITQACNGSQSGVAINPTTTISFLNYQVTPRVWKTKICGAPFVSRSGYPYQTDCLGENGTFNETFAGNIEQGATGELIPQSGITFDTNTPVVIKKILSVIATTTIADTTANIFATLGLFTAGNNGGYSGIPQLWLPLNPPVGTGPEGYVSYGAICNTDCSFYLGNFESLAPSQSVSNLAGEMQTGPLPAGQTFGVIVSAECAFV